MILSGFTFPWMVSYVRSVEHTCMETYKGCDKKSIISVAVVASYSKVGIFLGRVIFTLDLPDR